MMTAYKLCRVEFRYWGMQNKIERFIHDIGEWSLQDIMRMNTPHTPHFYIVKLGCTGVYIFSSPEPKAQR